MICDKRTENHNFTITTNTSQHMEFFHSLIFDINYGNVLSNNEILPVTDVCNSVNIKFSKTG